MKLMKLGSPNITWNQLVFAILYGNEVFKKKNEYFIHHNGITFTVPKSLNEKLKKELAFIHR
jgi:hypothetical protein